MKTDSKFDLKAFITDLVTEFDELEISEEDNYTWLLYNGDVVVDYLGDVNYYEWHNGCFEDHPTFKFESGSIEKVIINSVERAEQFKHILRIHFKKN